MDQNQSNIDLKKKQKPGLNAIRPSDGMERMFKNMAKDKGLTQTEMFERIFLNFINDERIKEKEKSFSIETDIELIATDLNSMLTHFKNTINKAQNEVISINNNLEQEKKTLGFQLGTLNKKNDELILRNNELENSNSAFEEIKGNLHTEIENYKALLLEKENKLKSLNLEVSNLKKDAELKDRTVYEFKNELKKYKELSEEYLTKIKRLELSNSNLETTLGSINKLKDSEISSIKSRYEELIVNMEYKLSSFNEEKEKDFRRLEEQYKKNLEIEKKADISNLNLKLADTKLKLAELNRKYSILLSEKAKDQKK